MEDILWVILGGFTASVALFIVGGALYTNPLVGKIYKESEGSPGLKAWPSVQKYLLLQYLGGLAMCILWAFVFYYVRSALPDQPLTAGLLFGLILTVTRVFPRFFDIWIQTTYPNRLLGVEIVNGTILSLIIGVVFAYIVT